jgi:dipeptidase D
LGERNKTMSSPIRYLSPTALWHHFADLNAVPRASKKEERVIQFAIDFGNSLGLETIRDHVGNVIIRKPATPGMEDRKPIVMQSHLDMVHQKNGDTIFDFDTQGIDMYIDGDWVKARGTTLGADNGIGVATIMAILASKDIVHPSLEALFTIDEETGMTGAMGLQGGMLHGEILLNLDTEEDDEIDIGCAGGLDVTAMRSYQNETAESGEYAGLQINVKGLKGGHSGVEIHLGRGNANKILNRLLYGQEANDLRLSSLEGGSLRNAIPRESTALVVVTQSKKDELLASLHQTANDIKKEFVSIESNLLIEINDVDTPSSVLTMKDHKHILNAIYAAHNGVFRMSPDIADLVEASNNVAKVDIKNGQAKILCLTRSSVESSKLDVAQSLRSVFELAGFDVTFSGDYPGWTPNVNSPILKVLTDLYEKMHGAKASVVACHAGLECGILGRNYPDMDMISYGPTIKGAHSPDERVNIASVEKFWDFTLEILKNVPEKV